jgi:DNA-binding transcriptional LysR family regulator
MASSISVKRLASEEMIMFPRAIAPALFDEILGFCRTAGFTLRIAQEARQTQTIISLASAGLGIAIVPASIRHLRRKGVVYRSFKEETAPCESHRRVVMRSVFCSHQELC